MDLFFKNVKDDYECFLNENNKSNCVKINIVLASNSEVGKTAFILRLMNRNYNYYMEEARDLRPFGISDIFDSYSLAFNHKDIIAELHIWDTQWLNSISCGFDKNLLKNTDIVFLFYDSYVKRTFETIKESIIFFNKKRRANIIFALIRNKYDKKRNYNFRNEEVSEEEALEFADKYNMLFFHLSLHEKYETGIKELFETVLNEYIIRKKIRCI